MDTDPIFQTVEKPRLSDEIARQIAQAIREGRFLPGQALPPERELTARFKVSRPILREALRILEIQGFINIRHGRGAFVKNQVQDYLNADLDAWLAQNLDLVMQFYEARKAIEPVCAALAATRASDEEIAALREMMVNEEQITGQYSIAIFVGSDIDFHNAIARMSGNNYLHQMLNALIVPETDMRKIVLRLPRHLPAAHNGHLAIVEAIQRRDPEAARQAMIAALDQPLSVIESYMGKK